MSDVTFWSGPTPVLYGSADYKRVVGSPKSPSSIKTSFNEYAPAPKTTRSEYAPAPKTTRNEPSVNEKKEARKEALRKANKAKAMRARH